MLRRGESIYRVQALLGHSTISTTADIYGHISAEDLRESVDRNAVGR